MAWINGSLAVLAAAAGAASPTPSPGTWIDPVTGHRIVRIDDTPGNYALYFNYNPFTSQGDLMIYLVPEGIKVVDLRTWETRLVLRTKVDRLLFAGPRSRSAYYTTRAADVEEGGPFQVWRVDLDSGATAKVADVPGGRIETINADETLLAGERELAAPPPDIAAQGRRDPKTGAPTYSGTGPDGKPLSFAAAKGQWMEKRLAARVPMEMYTVAIRDGRRRTLHRATDWLNHVQFSPTDPRLLMFCHEGPWDKVDRIWTIRSDGTGLAKVHTRTVAGEIAGHEFWASDGHTIWYDLRTVRAFAWLASYNVKTGARTQLLQGPDQASYHFSLSPDGRAFSGDGGNGAKWISLFRPRLDRTPQAGLITPGTLETEHLASLATHDYTLEPNQHWTPDGRWLIYRTNMEGAPALYAVEVAKAR
ncbi:oligogalacturonate lyase family protein [Sphingomonas aracearum]|uniref:Oligogalacturonate lyase n=1 Tax=Sphingomonas aracearum TaxID=2283317 RepID=A0A369VYD4_9SPHN|nr:oligogalacturonate lyase family protein [Sphingomonas aracearum]RDE07318.1 oligogalacturonate lyase [Sphingomonas aracearum]